MPDASPERALPPDVVNRLIREFSQGLEARLQALRTTLADLEAHGTVATREVFFHTAHSLKGTAAAYEATELIEPAAALAELGRGWFRGEPIHRDGLNSASQYLATLTRAVDAFRARVPGENA